MDGFTLVIAIVGVSAAVLLVREAGARVLQAIRYARVRREMDHQQSLKKAATTDYRRAS